MQRYLITGANRGIGLALVKALAGQESARIFATCRKPPAAAALNALADSHPDRVTVLPLDVTDGASITAAAEAVAAQVDGLDVLINNAGINPPAHYQTLASMAADRMLSILQVNSVAPLMVVQALADLLRAGQNPRIANISSGMGSMADTTSGGHYGYRTSKAALNMVTRILAADLRGDGIVAVTINPGWVKTDMGGPGASLEPAQSAAGVLSVIAGLTSADSGRFFNWDGTPHPW